MTTVTSTSAESDAAQVPDAWGTTKLRFLLEVNPATPAELRAQNDRLVSFIPMEALGEDGSLDTTRERPVGELLTGYSYFANNDVLLAKVTPCFENGKAALVQTLPGEHGFGSTEVTTLRANEGLDPLFLYYLVRSDHFRQASIASMTGAGGLKRVPDEHIRSFEAPVPSVAEQREIAKFLDRETAKIDALIDKQEQLIATLREDREAVVAHSVMKGLNENASLSFVEPLRTSIPEHWKVMPLRRIGNLVTGGTPPTTEDGHFSSSDEGIPWFRPDDMDESGRPSIASKYLSASGETLVPILPANSVHVVSIGSIGKVGYVDTVSSSNQQITAITNAASPKFLYFAIAALKDQLWASSMGTTLSILSAGRLGSVKVPYPPLEEQRAISAFLDLQCQKVDKLIDRSQVMIEVLREYRSALITNAVTGKIDVREAV